MTNRSRWDTLIFSTTQISVSISQQHLSFRKVGPEKQIRQPGRSDSVLRNNWKNYDPLCTCLTYIRYMRYTTLLSWVGYGYATTGRKKVYIMVARREEVRVKTSSSKSEFCVMFQRCPNSPYPRTTLSLLTWGVDASFSSLSVWYLSFLHTASATVGMDIYNHIYYDTSKYSSRARLLCFFRTDRCTV